MKYTFTFNRSDKAKDTKRINAETFRVAFNRLIEIGLKNDVKISNVQVGIDGTGTHIEFCNGCQKTECVKKFKCKDCKV